MKIQNKKEHILEQATILFSKEGYHGLKMDNLAEIAKVNKASIYYHIGNKDALYEAVLIKYFKSFKTVLENIYDEKQSPENNIKLFLKTVLNENKNNNCFFKIMLHEVASGWVNIPDNIFKFITEIFFKIRQILDPAIKENKLNEKDPILTHMFIFSSMMIFSQVDKTRTKLKKLTLDNFPDIEKDFPNIDKDTQIDSYIDYIFHGIFKKEEK